MSRYGVGDRVKVRSDLVLHKDYSSNDRNGMIAFTQEMARSLGKVYTIVRVDRDGDYVLDYNHSCWFCDEMLDLTYAPEETKAKAEATTKQSKQEKISIAKQQMAEAKELYNKLQAEIEELEKIADGYNTGRVGHGENYYSFSSDFNVESDTDINITHDNHMYEIGNYFSIKEKAEQMAKRVSLMLRMQRFADEHNEEIDWSDYVQVKYYIDYDNTNNAKHLTINCTCYLNHFSSVYFSSQNIATEALETFRAELEALYNNDKEV